MWLWAREPDAEEVRTDSGQVSVGFVFKIFDAKGAITVGKVWVVVDLVNETEVS